MTLFNDEQATTEQSDDTTKNVALQTYADTLAQKLVAIKREDGTPKYESVEAALEALLHSQTHIRNVENDNAELKSQAAKVKQLEDALARLEGSGNREQPVQKTLNSGGLSEAEARELVNRELDNRSKQTVAFDNLKSVNAQLINKYGSEEKAKEAVKLKAKELDMSLTELEELSKIKPKAVLAYFGGGSSTPVSTNSSTVRLSGTPPESNVVTRPEKSLLSGPGATGKNQMEHYRRIRDNVMKKFERGELG